jgi:hypothetical protein
MAQQSPRTNLPGPRQNAQPDIETGDAPISPEAGIENAEANDFERSQEDVPSDDPGDAQRASKSEPDGDGEEQSR